MPPHRRVTHQPDHRVHVSVLAKCCPAVAPTARRRREHARTPVFIGLPLHVQNGIMSAPAGSGGRTSGYMGSFRTGPMDRPDLSINIADFRNLNCSKVNKSQNNCWSRVDLISFSGLTDYPLASSSSAQNLARKEAEKKLAKNLGGSPRISRSERPLSIVSPIGDKSCGAANVR
jgi:hypothetical protein